MKRIALLAAVLASLALPGLAQQERPFAEQIDVNAVLLDVIVTDAKGNQILGLGKDDFVVTENGVRQDVDSLDYFTNRQLLDQREENAPFKVERVREERYFIFFFDRPTDPSTLFDQLARARDAVRTFIRDEMKDTDLVAVAGHDVRLKIYSDFTSDKAALEKAVGEASRFGPGIVTKPAAGNAPSILAHLNVEDMMNTTGTVYEALDMLADSTRPIRARKNLVLFSPGIVDQHEDVRNGMIVSRSPDLDPMLQSLNAANVSVFGVQLIRNVDTSPLFHQRLMELADSTGGRYYQFSTNFTPTLDRIESLNSGYYLLTWRSKHAAGETGFQKVEVKLKNPELRVVTRAGYGYGEK
jgi:VWFA-related protein